MPLIVKGKSYPLPSEIGQKSITGREIVDIESYFEGLDGLTLISTLGSDGKAPVGYTRAKAMFALAWIALARGGEILSLEDVLNDYTIEDFEFAEEETKKSVSAEDQAEPINS